MAIVLSFLRMVWPYLLSAFLGFNLAWVIQQTRIDKVTNEFDSYKNAILAEIANEHERTNKITEETNDDWHKNLDALHAYYKFRAGRMLPTCPPVRTDALPGSSKVLDGGPADVAVGARGNETEVTVEECAVTTLQLLELQAWTRALRLSKNGN